MFLFLFWPTFPKQTNLHSSTWRSGSTGQSEEDSQSGSGSEVLWVGEVVATGDKQNATTTKNQMVLILKVYPALLGRKKQLDTNSFLFFSQF